MDEQRRPFSRALLRRLGFGGLLCSALALWPLPARADDSKGEPATIETGAPARVGAGASRCSLLGHSASSPECSELDVSSCTTPQGLAFVSALRIELSGSRPAVSLRVADGAATGAQTAVACAVEDCALEAGRVIVVAMTPEAAQGAASNTNRARLPIGAPTIGMAPMPGVARPSSRTVIDLSDVALVARPRTAAIAVAELARTRLLRAAVCTPEAVPSGAQAVPATPNSTTPAPQNNEAPALDAARRSSLLGEVERSSRPRVGAGPWVTLYNEKQTLLVGASALGDVGLRGALRLVTSVSYARASSETPYGTPRLTWMGASAGPDLVMSTTPELRLGVRVGVARVRAQGASFLGVPERSLVEVVVLGSGGVGVHVPIARRWWLQGGMEVGTPLEGARFAAGGYRSLSIWGLFLGWHASVLFAL